MVSGDNINTCYKPLFLANLELKLCRIFNRYLRMLSSLSLISTIIYLAGQWLVFQRVSLASSQLFQA